MVSTSLGDNLQRTKPLAEPGKLKRYVLTGAPGAGKTAIIRQFEVYGFSVVEEAATDIIAHHQAGGLDEPWFRDSFIDEIADLQRTRLLQSSYCPGEVQFHDRSIFCTAALSDYFGRPRSSSLTQELGRAVTECWFQPEVFFILSLGFVNAFSGAPNQFGGRDSFRAGCTRKCTGPSAFRLSLLNRRGLQNVRTRSKHSFEKSASEYRRSTGRKNTITLSGVTRREIIGAAARF